MSGGAVVDPPRRVVFQGRAKPDILYLPNQNMKRCHHILVSVGESDILFLKPQRRRRMPSMGISSCMAAPPPPAVLHRVSFEGLRKVALTRFSNTSVVLTLLKNKRKGNAGAILLFLSHCVFNPTLDQQYERNVVRLKRSNSLPVSSVLFHREPQVECVICRQQNKLSEIKPRIAPKLTKVAEAAAAAAAAAASETCVVCLEPIATLSNMMDWTGCNGGGGGAAGNDDQGEANNVATGHARHGCCRQCLLTYLESKGVDADDRNQFVDLKALRKQQEEEFIRKCDWDGW